MNVQKEYLKPREASKKFNISTTTLIAWDKKGLIETFRTQGGQRRYLSSSIRNQVQGKQEQHKRICYCRVSSHAQKEDLERQVEYMRNKYPTYTIIKDIGSGINFKRKGFKAILEQAVKGDIKELVVTHRDRLCRFGFELVENILKNFNGTIVVLNHEEKTYEQELVEDLISITTVFSSRLYGHRSHSIKNQLEHKDCENVEDEAVS